MLPQTNINVSVENPAVSYTRRFTGLERCTAVSSPEAWSKEKATSGFRGAEAWRYML
jgi:hypothetical protein